MERWPWIVAAAAAAAILLPRLLWGGKVSSQVVRQKLASGAVVLDVRTAGEFRAGAHPGAVNIPVQALAGRMSELPRDRPIVVYCASGTRSAWAAGVLKRDGFGDVANAGGLSDMPR